MWLTLWLAIAPDASALVPVTETTCTVGTVDTATQPACDCLFTSDFDDWTNPADDLDPTDTCFDFMTIVNDVPYDRSVVLQRMRWMGNYYALRTCRIFDHTTAAAVVPVEVDWQELSWHDSMGDSECNIDVAGLSATEKLEHWFDEDRDRIVLNDVHGEEYALVKKPELLELVSVWEVEEEGEESTLHLLWDDGTIWELAEPIENLPTIQLAEDDEEE